MERKNSLNMIKKLTDKASNIEDPYLKNKFLEDLGNAKLILKDSELSKTLNDIQTKITQAIESRKVIEPCNKIGTGKKKKKLGTKLIKKVKEEEIIPSIGASIEHDTSIHNIPIEYDKSIEVTTNETKESVTGVIVETSDNNKYIFVEDPYLEEAIKILRIHLKQSYEITLHRVVNVDECINNWNGCFFDKRLLQPILYFVQYFNEKSKTIQRKIYVYADYPALMTPEKYIEYAKNNLNIN